MGETFNRRTTLITRLPQVQTNADLDDLPYVAEVKKADILERSGISSIPTLLKTTAMDRLCQPND